MTNRLRLTASAFVVAWATGAMGQTATTATPSAQPGTVVPTAPAAGAAPLPVIPTPAPTNGRPPVRELTADELAELRERMIRQSGAQILTPADIGAIRDRVIAADGAARLGTSAPPQPRARILEITPKAATAAPEQVNLAFGVVTPVTFTDAANRPWPVASVAYDPRMFAEGGAGCGGGTGGGGSSGQTDRPTTINLMPCRVDTWGNVSIQLEGYPWPIVLMVRSNAREPSVDIPVTVRIVKSGPSPLAAAGVEGLAVPRTTASVPRAPGAGVPKGEPGTDRYLVAFAAGTPPLGADRVRVSGNNDVEAWAFQGRIYLRGRITLLNPVHEATADRGDIHVWRLAPTSRVLVTLEDGTETALTLAF